MRWMQLMASGMATVVVAEAVLEAGTGRGRGRGDPTQAGGEIEAERVGTTRRGWGV